MFDDSPEKSLRFLDVLDPGLQDTGETAPDRQLAALWPALLIRRRLAVIRGSSCRARSALMAGGKWSLLCVLLFRWVPFQRRRQFSNLHDNNYHHRCLTSRHVPAMIVSLIYQLIGYLFCVACAMWAQPEAEFMNVQRFWAQFSGLCMVSVYNVYITNQFQTIFFWWRGESNSGDECKYKYQERKLSRFLSQLRPRIRPLHWTDQPSAQLNWYYM